jgi:hypothetical protein
MPELSTNINAALQPEELEFLNGLFIRAYQVIYGKEPYHNIRPEDKERKKLVSMDNIRVASISFKMPIPDIQSVKTESFQYYIPDYKSIRYTSSSSFKPAKIFEAIEKSMEYHDEKGSKPINYILLNELAISLDDHKEVIKKMKNEYARDKEIYIIPGTFQCNKGCFNVAPVISPWDKGDEDYFSALKQNCAKYQGENIRTPDYRYITRFRTIHGVMSVWICLDIYDPALVLKLLANNMRLSRVQRDIIDIIFIPSFNSEPKEKVEKALKFISKMTRTAVFLANGSFSQHKKNSNESAWIDNIGFYMGRKIKKFRNIRTDEYVISVFDIKWKKHKEEQNRPFDYGYSSPFNQIIGVREYSIQNIPD